MVMFALKDRGVVQHKNEGEYFLELCQEANAIRFSVKYHGFVHAYVAGDFNGWKKNDDYKLTWQVDPNDGVLKMVKEVHFPEGLRAGKHQYEYILVDCEGNEVWVNEWNTNGIDLSFIWEPFVEGLEIKVSNTVITPNSTVELVAVNKRLYGNRSIADVSWSVEPAIDGAIIVDGKLSISSGLSEGTEIVVKAKCDGLEATKNIYVSHNLEQGTFVHFIKSEGDYAGYNHWWNYWTFSDGAGAYQAEINMDTDMGKATYIKEDKVIARKKIWGYGWENDWNEQTPAFYVRNLSSAYIIYGDYNLHTSLRDVISLTKPKIQYAIMDESMKIRATLSHAPLIGTEYSLWVNGVKDENVSIIVKDKQREVIFTDIPTTINPSDLLEIRANNMFAPCKVLMRDFLDNFYYEGDDMGAKFTRRHIKLRVWAPTAYKVETVIYNNYDDENPAREFQMEYDNINGTHFTSINKEDNENKYFLYRLYFRELDKDGNMIDKITYAVDPYATAVGVNGDKGALVDIMAEISKPEGWDEDKRPELITQEDSVLYEMHIRDFTIDRTSGVSEELKGTFLGAVEEGTTYTDTATGKCVKTGLDHLVDLGVTHAHLLPVFDFASVDESKAGSDENRNWGYDPKNYNVPEGSYSTNAFDPITRIKEFRTMVQKFHKKGIRVVMDMVYNHMQETANMDKIVPGYYFRTDYNGKFTNGSGCGNEMATEKPMVRKFIVDSNLHWVKNYNVDGLRFDLMELIDLQTVKEITNKAQEVDPSIIVYGEPWKGGDSPVRYGTHKGTQRNNNFSVFNDTFRDALRGGNEPSKGFINGDAHSNARAWTVVEGIKGSVNGLTAKPQESINYIEAHDNYAIWDQIEKSQNTGLQHGGYRNNITANPFDNHYVRQSLLGAGIILTSQGVPFFQEASEILRTKQGDHNSYKSDDKINAIHWDDKVKYEEVFNYYKGLIELRRKHPAFRMISADQVRENLGVYFHEGNDKGGVIISHLKNNANGDKWRNIVVIYNSTSIDGYNINESLPIPCGGKWNVVVNDNKAGVEVLHTANAGEVPGLRSHSMMVIYDEEV